MADTSVTLAENLQATADYILRLQLPSGALPWFAGGITDPWDHVEAVMGLTVAGHHQAALKGVDWLANNQREDGAWFAAYQNNAVADDTRAETNFVAYAATGLWHYHLATGDTAALDRFWPMLRKAITFVLGQQAPSGEIYWAVDSRTGTSKDALVTGCSAIYKSLACACHVADALGEDCTWWRSARHRLGDALRNKPERFDRTWESKARYSMDWFYPVLTGVLSGEAATKRINEKMGDLRGAGPWLSLRRGAALGHRGRNLRTHYGLRCRWGERASCHVVSKHSALSARRRRLVDRLCLS